MGNEDIEKNVDSKEIENGIEQIKKNVGSISMADKLSSKIEEKLILFISFDLVNSSSYKTRNYSNWFNVIINIIENIKKAVFEKIEKAQLWRTIGDEAVFIVEIANKKQLEEDIESVFEILNVKMKEIKNGNILNDIVSENEKKIFKVQSELSLKSTVWLASVVETSSTAWLKPVIETDSDDNSKKTIDVYNLMYLYNDDGKSCPTYEFQGNDIDTGFRLSKFTRNRRLTLSLELAYILTENHLVEPKINIITYRSLKGIWNDRIYPIIWYHDSNIAGSKLEDSFFYDEYYTDDITKEFIDNKFCKINFQNGNTSFQKLRKIVKDNNLLEKIAHLESLMSGDGEIKEVLSGSNLLEVHCVAIVMNKNKDKVLMFKRAKDSKKYSGKWDFGFCQIHNGQEFKENIKKDYKSKYSIDIDVFDPIKDYSFTKNGRKVPGIVYFAKISEKSGGKPIKLNDKDYEDYEFKDIDKIINNSNPEEYVAYEEYKETLEFLKKYIKNVQGEHV